MWTPGKRQIFVDCADEQIAIEYDMGRLERGEISKRLGESDRPGEALLTQIVTAWDITEHCTEACERRKRQRGDVICRDHALPVTRTTIRLLPDSLVSHMIFRIVEDAERTAS